MTITLLPHQVARLEAIVSAIPRSKRRIGVDKWHRVLSELRSMALTLPGARGMFGQMKESLCHVIGKMVTQSKGVHEALEDFRWLSEDVSNFPTRIYKQVSLRPTVDSYHNASGYMCGGMVLPGPTVIPHILPPQPSAAQPYHNPIAAHPIVWRTPLTKDNVDSLVSWEKSQETVNNSELELAGGIIQSEFVAQCFVVTERTIFS